MQSPRRKRRNIKSKVFIKQEGKAVFGLPYFLAWKLAFPWVIIKKLFYNFYHIIKAAFYAQCLSNPVFVPLSISSFVLAGRMIYKPPLPSTSGHHG